MCRKLSKYDTREELSSNYSKKVLRSLYAKIKLLKKRIKELESTTNYKLLNICRSKLADTFEDLEFQERLNRTEKIKYKPLQYM